MQFLGYNTLVYYLQRQYNTCRFARLSAFLNADPILNLPPKPALIYHVLCIWAGYVVLGLVFLESMFQRGSISTITMCLLYTVPGLDLLTWLIHSKPKKAGTVFCLKQIPKVDLSQTKQIPFY